MVGEIRYTSIKRILDNLLEHPMLSDLTLEQVVRYTIRFIQINGFPKLYEDKIDTVDIHEFRGLLPCDLISIIQVRDCRTHVCMRAMTDSFTPGLVSPPTHSPHPCVHGELSFKTQERVIFTSFPEGRVEIAYKAIPTDEDGFPKLIDNETFLAALEAYIKKAVFTIKFDQGKITAGVLQNAQSDYAWLAGQLNSELTIPSYSEAEAMSRYITTLIPKMREFDNAFKNLGSREYLRRH